MHAPEDLLQTALARTFAAWSRVAEPEAYTRRVGGGGVHQRLRRPAADAQRRQRRRAHDRAHDPAATGRAVPTLGLDRSGQNAIVTVSRASADTAPEASGWVFTVVRGVVTRLPLTGAFGAAW